MDDALCAAGADGCAAVGWLKGTCIDAAPRMSWPLLCKPSGRLPLLPHCRLTTAAAASLHALQHQRLQQALVTKSMPKGLAHITSLKHVTELKLEEAPKGGAGGGTDGGGGAVRFACPVTGQAFNGKYKFVVLRKSGHVLSERALKEVRRRVEGPWRVRAGGGRCVCAHGGWLAADEDGWQGGWELTSWEHYSCAGLTVQCPLPRLCPIQCKQVPKVVEEMVGGKWDPADLLPVNPSGEELQEMREQLLLKRAAERVAKKERKKDKAAANGNGMAAAAAGAGAGAPPAAAAGAKRSADNGVNGSAPAAAPAAEGKRFKAAELKPKGADDKVCWGREVVHALLASGQRLCAIPCAPRSALCLHADCLPSSPLCPAGVELTLHQQRPSRGWAARLHDPRRHTALVIAVSMMAALRLQRAPLAALAPRSIAVPHGSLAAPPVCNCALLYSPFHPSSVLC